MMFKGYGAWLVFYNMGKKWKYTFFNSNSIFRLFGYIIGTECTNAPNGNAAYCPKCVAKLLTVT